MTSVTLRTPSESELTHGASPLEQPLGRDDGAFEVTEATRPLHRTVLEPLDAMLDEPAEREGPSSDTPPPRTPVDSAARQREPEPEPSRELDDGRAVARMVNVALTGLTLAAGLVAVALGAIGATSDEATATEARALAELPPFTTSNVLEGRFTQAVEPYLADRFPARGSMLELEAAMRCARGIDPGEDDLVVYRVSSEALDLGADPEADLDFDEDAPPTFGAAPPSEIDPPAGDVEPGPVQGAEPTAPTTPDDTAVEAPAAAARRFQGTTRVSAGVLIRDGRAMQGFGGHPDGAPEYARTMNAIHEAIGERATMYALIVPTAQEFYLPHGTRSRVREERPNITAT